MMNLKFAGVSVHARYLSNEAAYFLASLWAYGGSQADMINRNHKNRIETNGAGRMAPKRTLNTSLVLEERCFHNSSLCLWFYFLLAIVWKY